jgi:hypothetical protein
MRSTSWANRRVAAGYLDDVLLTVRLRVRAWLDRHHERSFVGTLTRIDDDPLLLFDDDDLDVAGDAVPSTGR